MPQNIRIAVISKTAFSMWDAYNMPEIYPTDARTKSFNGQNLQLEEPWRFDSKKKHDPCTLCSIQAVLQGPHPWKRKFRHKNGSSQLSLYIKMRDGYGTMISTNRRIGF
ncbi:uncharacterized protein N7479_001835 [Penicillium vulpinum]|uniref:uncharacterized protein n=1 Tax=Penicillium vulpinum TaxID=29845 RepID=UPI0025473E24|nr:uncharacterized protein N7479_001835 [Penicillium vulpinum]KAJ5971917.1 hypothetical protein N7479_001835 [Penicillium vulpinum]